MALAVVIFFVVGITLDFQITYHKHPERLKAEEYIDLTTTPVKTSTMNVEIIEDSTFSVKNL